MSTEVHAAKQGGNAEKDAMIMRHLYESAAGLSASCSLNQSGTKNERDDIIHNNAARAQQRAGAAGWPLQASLMLRCVLGIVLLVMLLPPGIFSVGLLRACHGILQPDDACNGQDHADLPPNSPFTAPAAVKLQFCFCISHLSLTGIMYHSIS